MSEPVTPELEEPEPVTPEVQAMARAIGLDEMVRSNHLAADDSWAKRHVEVHWRVWVPAARAALNALLPVSEGMKLAAIRADAGPELYTEDPTTLSITAAIKAALGEV
jgi:hypothetical protein